MSQSDNRPKPKPPVKRLSVRQVETRKEEQTPPSAPKSPKKAYSDTAVPQRTRPSMPRNNPPAPQDEVDALLEQLIKSYETNDRNSK